ncbi:MAG: hypothetical protein ACO396_04385, partial [Phycisphaerales bacterium]
MCLLRGGMTLGGSVEPLRELECRRAFGSVLSDLPGEVGDVDLDEITEEATDLVESTSGRLDGEASRLASLTSGIDRRHVDQLAVIWSSGRRVFDRAAHR